jgi:hypothetical protein
MVVSSIAWLGDSFVIDDINKPLSDKQPNGDRSIDPKEHYTAVICMRKGKTRAEKKQRCDDKRNSQRLEGVAPPAKRLSIEGWPAKCFNALHAAERHCTQWKQTHKDKANDDKNPIGVDVRGASWRKTLVSANGGENGAYGVNEHPKTTHVIA